MAHPTGSGLGVDLGTSNTVAIARWADGRSRALLFDGQPLLPTGVYLDPGGNLLAGRDAERMAQADPARYEPNPKRRIDDGGVLLGDRFVPVTELFAAPLRAVALAAREALGFVPPAALSYPAAWGPNRRQTLVDAAALAAFPSVRLVPEPIAAARYLTGVLRHPVPPGGTVAVFDFGAGTLDVALVRAAPGGFSVLGAGGAADLGGLDIDEALVQHLGQLLGREHPDVWRQLQSPADDLQRRHRKAFWADVRAAKEMLSRTAVAPVPIPGVSGSVHVTREELEQLATPLLRRAVGELSALLRSTGIAPAGLSGIFLVGGTSRVPLVARLLHSELGLAPTVLEQPELPVAEGALLDASPTAPAPVAATRSGSLPPVSAQPVSPHTGPPWPVSVPPVHPVSPAVAPRVAPLPAAPLPAAPLPARPRARAFRRPGPWIGLIAGLLVIVTLAGGLAYVILKPNPSFAANPKQVGVVTIDGAGNGQFMGVVRTADTYVAAQVGREVEVVSVNTLSGLEQARARLGDAATWQSMQVVGQTVLVFSAPDAAGKQQVAAFDTLLKGKWTLTISKDDQLRSNVGRWGSGGGGIVWLDTAKNEIKVIDDHKGQVRPASVAKLTHGERIINRPTEPMLETYLLTSTDTVERYTVDGKVAPYATPYKVRPTNLQLATVHQGQLYVADDAGIGAGGGTGAKLPVPRPSVGPDWLGHCGDFLCAFDTPSLATSARLTVYDAGAARYSVSVSHPDPLASPPVAPTSGVRDEDAELVVPILRDKAPGALVLSLTTGKSLGEFPGRPVLVDDDAVLTVPSTSFEVVHGVKLTGIDLPKQLKTSIDVGDVRPSTCDASLFTLVCARDHDFAIWQFRSA